MKLPKIESKNLHKYLDKEDIVQATIKQIQKDFALFRVNLDFTGDFKDAYPILMEKLSRQVRYMTEENDRIFLSILYQIDLSEDVISRARLEFPQMDHYELLAHQIIERELKKVLMREYFKNNPDF